MKRLPFVILLFITFAATSVLAQQTSAFKLDRMPSTDTLLTGWKIYAGDNAAFADPAYDDSQWQPVDLNQDIQQLSPLRRSGMAWLRLHINADSIITSRPLAAYIIQYTASEIFLNGKLFKQYGVVGNTPDKVRAYLPSPAPFPIRFETGKDNVISVRMAYQPGLPYISLMDGPLPAFEMRIGNTDNVMSNYLAGQRQSKIYIIIYSFSTGTLLIVGIIYLVYFLYDRKQKVHLYYALSVLALSLNAAPIEVWGADRYGFVDIACWVYYFEAIFFMIGTLLMLQTIYTIFNYPYRKTFIALSTIALITCVPMYIYGTPAFFWASNKYPVICLLNGVYVCWWAIRRNIKDARVILVGLFFYIGFTILSSIINVDSISSQLLFYIAQMAFPVGMSFYLGIQSSLINKQLSTTLQEVRHLSARNLQQEWEKQQLLAAQNELLEKQVNERTSALNQSLSELKAAQSQLIHSEKMASLGELTAGIAHEIQNPLNFVNNFSDISNELMDEMNDELNKGDIEEAKAISNNIKQNLGKISHHGKRADAIVKGMLLHSRTSVAQKEPTDINALADEYLRLAYHGHRAKDKTFNASMETSYDPSIETIHVIPQDISRVILNLITNAFYAITEKAATDQNAYQPMIWLTTKKIDHLIYISVRDNGNGISTDVIDKIFQPFFTTKPTGQGTGLGLSLSYDIVKAHGGELKVESMKGQGSTFTIQLPIS